MKSIALVSCGKSKLEIPAQAKDLYTGDLFKKARNYVERTHDGWFILSALHGLVHPDTELEPYEKTLTTVGYVTQMKWARKVSQQISETISTDNKIVIYAGLDYRKFLVPDLEEKGYIVESPLQGLGIGYQKAWFKKRELKT